VASGKSVVVRRLSRTRAQADFNAIFARDMALAARAAWAVVSPPRALQFIDRAAPAPRGFVKIKDTAAAPSAVVRAWVADPAAARSLADAYALWRDAGFRYVWNVRNRRGEMQMDNDLAYYCMAARDADDAAALHCYVPGPVSAARSGVTYVESAGTVPVRPARVIFCVNLLEYDWVLPDGTPRSAASLELYNRIRAATDAPLTVMYTHWDVFPAKLALVDFAIPGVRNDNYAGPSMSADGQQNALEVCSHAVIEYLSRQYKGAYEYRCVDARHDVLFA